MRWTDQRGHATTRTGIATANGMSAPTLFITLDSTAASPVRITVSRVGPPWNRAMRMAQDEHTGHRDGVAEPGERVPRRHRADKDGHTKHPRKRALVPARILMMI